MCLCFLKLEKVNNIGSKAKVVNGLWNTIICYDLSKMYWKFVLTPQKNVCNLVCYFGKCQSILLLMAACSVYSDPLDFESSLPKSSDILELQYVLVSSSVSWAYGLIFCNAVVCGTYYVKLVSRSLFFPIHLSSHLMFICFVFKDQIKLKLKA